MKVKLDKVISSDVIISSKRCLICGIPVNKSNSVKIKNNMYICYECYKNLK